MEFQSSPSPEAGCNRTGPRLPCGRSSVSILTQPGSRVQPRRRQQLTLACIQDHVSILTQPGSRVQRGPGGRDLRPGRVSILTQPGSRVQPGDLSRKLDVTMFQSSPSPEAGCNGACSRRTPTPNLFQSSPSPEAGCNWSRAAGTSSAEGFQSSPSPEAGCNPVKSHIGTSYTRLSSIRMWNFMFESPDWTFTSPEFAASTKKMRADSWAEDVH